MSKTLLLLRHAKSGWDDPTLDDFDRPLNARGRKAAPRIGVYIRDTNLIPDLVLCSAARRAKDTWALVHEAMGDEAEVKLMKSLYLASPSRFLRAIHRVPGRIQRLLVIAHNPGIHELAIRFQGDSIDERTRILSNEMRAKFPTAALAILTFNTGSWSDVTYGQARLQDFVRPRQLQ